MGNRICSWPIKSIPVSETHRWSISTKTGELNRALNFIGRVHLNCQMPITMLLPSRILTVTVSMTCCLDAGVAELPITETQVKDLNRLKKRFLNCPAAAMPPLPLQIWTVTATMIFYSAHPADAFTITEMRGHHLNPIFSWQKISLQTLRFSIGAFPPFMT